MNKQEDENEESEEDDIEPKHKPGRILSNTNPIYKEFQEEINKYGYHLCFDSEHSLFKIQGTFALQNRFDGDRKTIRSCFFIATYAIMNAIIKPLSKWNSKRIDKILENGQELYNKLENKSTSITRQIKNMIIDEYQFHVKLIIYKPFIPRKSLDIAIKQVILKEEYFIIQIRNTSFAIYKDQYFHLFDPYKPSEIKNEKNKEKSTIKSNNNDDDDENKDKNNTQKQCSKMSETIPDKDTASWILFVDLDSMLKYIENRAASENWKKEYRIHILQILSYQEISEKIQLQSLSQEDFTNDITNFNSKNILCLPIEKITWLNDYPHNIPWNQINNVRFCSENKQNLLDICKIGAYQTEISNTVYSLWGNIHPTSMKFHDTKQILAINVIACCMAQIYRFHEWNDKILDSIVEHGNKYYQNSLSSVDIKKKDDNYNMKLEDLDIEYNMNYVNFQIHIEGVFYGILYNNRIQKKELNLSTALIYLFTISRYGIIQCLNKFIAIGRGLKGYFLFDCQSKGKPLFKNGKEKVYNLWCKTLQKLLYCIILTLGIPYHDIYFIIYKIDINPRLLGDQYEENERKLNENQTYLEKNEEKGVKRDLFNDIENKEE